HAARAGPLPHYAPGRRSTVLAPAGYATSQRDLGRENLDWSLPFGCLSARARRAPDLYLSGKHLSPPPRVAGPALPACRLLHGEARRGAPAVLSGRRMSFPGPFDSISRRLHQAWEERAIHAKAASFAAVGLINFAVDFAVFPFGYYVIGLP